MATKELLRTVKKGDMVKYVRKNGDIDTEYLNGDVRLDPKDMTVWHNKNTIVLGLEDHPEVNKAIYLYKRKPNGDLEKHTVYEEES